MAKMTRKFSDAMLQRVAVELSHDGTGAAGASNIQVPSSIGPTDKQGILIHHVEYMVQNMQAVLAANGEDIRMGLSNAAGFVETHGYDFDSLGWIDIKSYVMDYHGTPANAVLVNNVFRSDFAHEPGGGRLVHPSTLYYWVGTLSGSWASTAITHCVIWYQTVDLKPEMYQELLELRVALSTI